MSSYTERPNSLFFNIHFFRRGSIPEVVRIRCESESANAHVHIDPNAPEVIRHPPGMQPQVLFQNNSETAAGVELDIPKQAAQFPGIKGGGAEIIRVKSSIHQGIRKIQYNVGYR